MLYDLTVKKQFERTAASGKPFAMQIQGPFLTVGEIGLLTGLVAFAVVVALVATLATGSSCGAIAICTDAFSVGLAFIALSWVRLRLTKADDWVGFLFLGLVFAGVMAAVCICLAVLT